MSYFGGGGIPQSSYGGPGKGSNQKQYVFKPKRHPLSLLKEGVSTVRYLADASQSIFQIVMPWRQEQEEEEKKRQKKLKREAEIKQQSLKKWITSGKSQQEEHPKRAITKEEEKYQQQLYDGELDENSSDFHKLQKVVKVKEVQKVRLQDYTQNVQAILINPKWRPCDHFTQLVKQMSQASGDSTNKKNSQDAN